MPLFTDQMGRIISLDKAPQKIISIVPSQTELLFDLGLKDEVVGITKFCVHPREMFHSKPRVGGTKKLSLAKIRELKPDLIIGNKEENTREEVEELMGEFPVWMSDIYTVADAVEMIRSIGEITNTEQKAQEITGNIQAAFKKLESLVTDQRKLESFHPKRTAYFIWRDPYMTAGSNTFIHHILEVCGLVNAFADYSRYPQVTTEELQAAAPELILLSSEPYPFKEKHIAEFQAICPDARIMVVDGEMFSWYGSRLLYAPAYFERLLTGTGK